MNRWVTSPPALSHETTRTVSPAHERCFLNSVRQAVSPHGTAQVFSLETQSALSVCWTCAGHNWRTQGTRPIQTCCLAGAEIRVALAEDASWSIVLSRGHHHTACDTRIAAADTYKKRADAMHCLLRAAGRTDGMAQVSYHVAGWSARARNDTCRAWWLHA